MKEHVFRLHRGMDLKQGIEDYCIKKNISSGAIVACIGCVYEIKIRTANGKDYYHEINNFEIVSLSGTISDNGMHIHLSLCDNDLKTIGGHLVNGTLVNTTAEIVLLEFEKTKLTRIFDESTGYDELVVKEK